MGNPGDVFQQDDYGQWWVAPVDKFASSDGWLLWVGDHDAEQVILDRETEELFALLRLCPARTPIRGFYRWLGPEGRQVPDIFQKTDQPDTTGESDEENQT